MTTAKSGFRRFFPGGGEAHPGIWENVDDDSVSDNFLRVVDLANVDPSEYNAYHFFNENARNLIFSDRESSLCYNLKVKQKFLSNLKYIIEKDGQSYTTEVADIILHIFCTDIAVLEISCVNNAHPSLEAVKFINEYGRRLAMPFWPDKGYTKVADSLSLSGDMLDISEDFKSFKGDKVSYSYVTKIFRELLNQNPFGIKFRAKTTTKEKEIQIRTLIDERMFCECLVVDEKYTKELFHLYKDHENTLPKEAAGGLWELLNVEIEGACKDKNPEVLRDWLKDKLFLDDFGGDMPKIMGVCEQSIIKLVSKSDYEIDFFNKIYSKVALIVLVQRISIAKYTFDINAWSVDLRNKPVTRRKIKEVLFLQEQIIAFRTQFMLNEITSKTEGTFIYDCLKKNTNISGEFEDLMGQSSSLYEFANTSQSDSISKWGAVLSMTALVFSIAGYILTANELGKISDSSFRGWVPLGVTVGVILVIIWIIMGVIYKKRRRV